MENYDKAKYFDTRYLSFRSRALCGREIFGWLLRFLSRKKRSFEMTIFYNLIISIDKSNGIPRLRDDNSLNLNKDFSPDLDKL